MEQLIDWIEPARACTGRFRPTLSVGRDGIFVRLLHEVFQEGATATIGVLDRQGKRVGTVDLAQMPESGQGTLTEPISAVLKAVLSQVESQSLRLVDVTDEGDHPSGYDHQVLKKRVDPRRPWRRLEWIRIVDFDHACLYVQQLGEEIFGLGDEARSWASDMRHVLKNKAAGVARVLQSASARRRHGGLCGQSSLYDQAYRYLKSRSQWMRYHLYKWQKWPIGSDITEAACKIVFTPRLKRPGMSWTVQGGQTILDLWVIKLSRVWEVIHQRYLASKPMPVARLEMPNASQHGKLAA